MTYLINFVANALCIFTLISVHEVGHFLAGWVGGIPWRAMRIRLFRFPQDVILRDGNEWIAPSNLDQYLPVIERHLGSGSRLYFYVAGGLLLETVFAVAAAVIAKAAGWPNLALMVAGMSLLFFVLLVFVMDVPWALYHRRAFFDVSGLWHIAKVPTALLVVSLLGTRMLLVWYVMS
jgi:hypothetical protein